MQCLKGQTAGKIGNLGQPLGSCSFEQAYSGHDRRAVGECQTFLGSKCDRRKASSSQRVRTVRYLAIKLRFAGTDEYACKMCQGSKIAACPETSLFGYDR